jgi:outer membrane immunogenic protein
MEIDGSWSNTKVTTFLIPESDDGRITSRLNALVTGRVRAGAALDNLLLYVTGGVAAARINTTWVDEDEAQIKEWRWGWVAGFGTEWAFTDRISLRSEVLYVDFVDRQHRVPFSSPDGNFANFTHSDSAWIARVGLNVKFGGPVAARY